MMHQLRQLLIILLATLASCAARDESSVAQGSLNVLKRHDHRIHGIHHERTRRSHNLYTSPDGGAFHYPIENTTAFTSEDIDQYFVDLVSAPAASHTLQNATCIEHEDPDCVIDHNITCVGEPMYCNLTYEEYVNLVYDYIYPSISEWILIFSHSIVFIMGLVGNALVCIAVYTNHSMRTVTNIFIVNLAVADFFVILFCLPPTVVWDVTETWFMGKTMCKIVLYFQTVSVTVSVLTLTFISIDRWYAICFPLRYVSTNERAIGSIAFIWLVALISDIPEFLTLTTQHKQLRFGITLFTQCVAQWDLETEKNFHIARFVMLYTLPLLIMTIAYFQIVRVLWKSDTIPGHRESRHHQQYNCGYLRNSAFPANSGTMGQLRMRRKAAKMLVAVVVMFACCYFPVNVLNVLRYTIDIGQSEVISILSLFSHWLCYANSAVNPVIYNFMSGKFRREFKNALEKCRCCGAGRDRVEDRSMYHSAHTPGTRLNNVSPSSRSNYQLANITRQQTLQTSFIENGHNNHHQVLLTADEKARRSSRP
ncbi:orexin/Hypocretin receptor type 1-like [Lutzomyia longipalpis]|uniref:orexin/Hypocretin receptor type 1-like n=1 Tax=Lutzomyia longipalpis TaxID=7200 RepID=UPI002483BD29|nr:orexin/Hypocretin receptor type 1-like [Lutzomyia longipalpis]XP_055696231.1 orexin/Hypocretin receptor type 1-like [Lutzomyia longipalpis]XP_055696232.1 orexin/Hypocretin receptor type 1-like [Lutzomyia longipalpis]